MIDYLWIIESDCIWKKVFHKFLKIGEVDLLGYTMRLMIPCGLLSLRMRIIIVNFYIMGMYDNLKIEL